MKLIMGPRGSGKTTEAVAYCVENQYNLVVRNEQMRKRVQKQLSVFNFTGEWDGRVLTHDELIRGTHEPLHPHEVFIDDVDVFIARVVGDGFAGGTMRQDIDIEIQSERK